MNKYFCYFFLFLALTPKTEAAQCEQQKLPTSSPFGERFGRSVDFDGSFAVVGDSVEDVNDAFDAGAAYVLHLENGVWVEQQRLISDELNFFAEFDYFGYAVAIDGTTAIVGAPRAGSSVRGIVFVYDFDGNSWVLSQKLIATAAADLSNFGASIALQDNRALIGATVGNLGIGSVLVLERSGTTWSEAAVLTPSDGQPNDQFGWSVALDGDTAIVGVPRINSYSGAAYIFDGSQGWAEVAKLVPADSQPNMHFGHAVAVRGTTALLGAYADDAPLLNCGSLYVYTHAEGAWQQTEKLVAPDTRSSLFFGYSVAIDNSVMAVGAPADSTGPSTYHYRELTGTWTFQAKLRGLGTHGSGLGSSLAIQGETTLAGAPNDTGPHGNIGAVYFFDMPTEFSPYCFGAGCPCNNDDPVRGCGNSVGWNGSNDPVGSLLTACGSGSVSADDLVLTLERVPANQFGLFYMGGGELQAPFGDGLRCVGAGGAGLLRYNPPQHSGSAGMLTLGPGIVARSQSFSANGHIDAGETWYFQGWYRDPMGPCGTAFNLSNGLAVTFAP